MRAYIPIPYLVKVLYKPEEVLQPIIPAFRRLEQEGCHRSETIQKLCVNSSPAHIKKLVMAPFIPSTG